LVWTWLIIDFAERCHCFITVRWSFTHKSQIYNRCEDGRFPVSAICVTISNPDSLSSSKTGVDPGIRS
jgi:hypothetical protein